MLSWLVALLVVPVASLSLCPGGHVGGEQGQGAERDQLWACSMEDAGPQGHPPSTRPQRARSRALLSKVRAMPQCRAQGCSHDALCCCP